MARTTLTKTDAPGNWATSGTTLTMTAADVTNKNQFVAGAKDLVVAYNSGASAATVTITSTEDPYNRTGDVASYSIAAGGHAIFGLFLRTGWMQADGYIYLEASSPDIKFGIVNLA